MTFWVSATCWLSCCDMFIFLSHAWASLPESQAAQHHCCLGSWVQTMLLSLNGALLISQESILCRNLDFHILKVYLWNHMCFPLELALLTVSWSLSLVPCLTLTQILCYWDLQLIIKPKIIACAGLFCVFTKCVMNVPVFKAGCSLCPVFEI